MRPSLAASLFPLISLLILFPSALALPADRIQALRELERLEERSGLSADAAYARVERGLGRRMMHPGMERMAAKTDFDMPPPAAAVGDGAAQPNVLVGSPPVALPAAPDVLKIPSPANAAASAEKQEPLTLTLDRAEAEAALLQVESVRRGLESLEELLKSAASLTRLASFKATTPEPPTLAPPPKALSDDPALHSRPGHGAHKAAAEPVLPPELGELMYNEHVHLQDLYYGSYPPTELFYNKDAGNDLREPVPLVPVNPEKFRDYSAHPKLTAEEFFGRNRRKGTR
ncbi:hypothetical protein CALVIDRAFT_567847 [Calocera viscosa TUFC12733]|uniref:SAP domain-containing protein n=1 Tax=Calocera viscosa (strain TUFC12733) TaxID=1330018 RepID=A0A167HTJ2_CALVF|nr:hypothetical protein CALVIDRAFT_567847 [Calocera viscosa TUFC12733]